jgi:hypothetical protein
LKGVPALFGRDFIFIEGVRNTGDAHERKGSS